jgi:hypothetical protein
MNIGIFCTRLYILNLQICSLGIYVICQRFAPHTNICSTLLVEFGSGYRYGSKTGKQPNGTHAHDREYHTALARERKPSPLTDALHHEPMCPNRATGSLPKVSRTYTNQISIFHPTTDAKLPKPPIYTRRAPLIKRS